MPLEVPEDIMHVLCEKLADAKDFDTLFQCALTAKRFAVPALTNLYRSHNESPVIGGGGDSYISPAHALLMIQKWSIMWRSIIASSIGATAFPYCRYIKTLDFRDLSYLLEEDKFRTALRGDISKSVTPMLLLLMKFFAGEMSQFKIMAPSKPGRKKRPEPFDIDAVVDAIGEAVTQHTPSLEQITGNVKPSALVKWAPRLPRLTSLQLWEGKALGDPAAQEAIITHCPKFDALSFYICHAGIGEGTLLSLGSHGQSLKFLKLALKTDALPHLGLLKNCTAIESLELDHIDVLMAPTDLEATQNDVFLEVRDWLGQCKSLRSLFFKGFIAAIKLVTPILYQDDIKLSHLGLDQYSAHAATDFHLALAHHSSLKWLHLTAESDGMTRDDIDLVLETLVQLKQLTHIKLLGVSDFFNDEHIITLARNLPHLDDVYFTSLQVGDAILPELANLKELRRVEVASISTFTFEGLIDFVDRLGPGNRGIEFMVSSAEPQSKLSDEEVMQINQRFAVYVDGKLDYVPYRGIVLFNDVMAMAMSAAAFFHG
ncbi:hypothetical protein GTA08_BOTSDO05852 [Neofusicoccum parvum]|nr:hypothetical protein GTA08_BOTSDO05852 [Neofusicoccum parvum]